MEVKILQEIDYTLNRKGDRRFIVVDMFGNQIPGTGCWKTLSACKKLLQIKGFVLKEVVTVHKNYEHWKHFKFAK